MAVFLDDRNGSCNQVLIWCATIEEIATADMKKDDSHWKFCLNEMTTTFEKKKILSFLFEEDQKRALVSILIQRAIIRDYLKATDDSCYSISRTPEVCTMTSNSYWSLWSFSMLEKYWKAWFDLITLLFSPSRLNWILILSLVMKRLYWVLFANDWMMISKTSHVVIMNMWAQLSSHVKTVSLSLQLYLSIHNLSYLYSVCCPSKFFVMIYIRTSHMRCLPKLHHRAPYIFLLILGTTTSHITASMFVLPLIQSKWWASQQ